MRRHQLRIIVVGAGVGGISVARGLLRDGHDVTVVERRPDVTAGGGAVTIWPNGAAVLEQLGVEMAGAGQPLTTLRIEMSSGLRMSTIDLAAIGDQLGAPVRMVPRRVLLERLLEDFPADHVRLNSAVVAARNTTEGVRVEFDDGSCDTSDLVVGADGLHSTIRSAVGAAAASPTGWCSWQGLITMPDIPDECTATNIIGSGANLGLWPAGGHDLQWWFDLPWSTDFVRPERPIELIRRTFRGWSAAVDQVLARLTDDDLEPSPFPHYRHPIPRTKRAGALTLLGDAAHTMPPFLAQGTNQALLDAMVLGRALADFQNGTSRGDGGLSGALRWYENTRRRRVAAVSRVAALQVSQPEPRLRPATLIPDRLATLALTAFLRSVSHRRMTAQVGADLAVAAARRRR
jgi:2-polyprenyl-6-methoxyphenol hydroxylase-like FAD-dependent oxidoreductase